MIAALARVIVAVALAITVGPVVVNAQEAPAPAAPAPATSSKEGSSVPANDTVALETPKSEPNPTAAAQVEAAGVPDAAADAGAAQAELTESELLELGIVAGDPAVDTSLHFSGFMDLGMQIGLNDFTKATVGGHPSFAIGNLNLYASKNLIESVRTMVEIRFLYLPNGARPAFGLPTVNTAIADYADFDRPLHWGGIEIERAYVEWSILTMLTIRAGAFLTPYGIWNVDHGSPTIIPTTKPYSIGAEFFPEHQTGLELYGRWGGAGDSVFGYHLTVSNGGGPASEWRDLDDNKAIGGRAYWEYRGLGEFRLGASAYYGRETDATTSVVFTGKVVKESDKINIQYDQLSLALDAVWKFRGWHLQAEWVSGQRRYTRAGRAAATGVTGVLSYPVDSFGWGGYFLGGYRFAWLGVMPYVLYQHTVQPDQFKGDGYSVGLNVRPIDALAIKVQYDWFRFPAGPSSDIRSVNLQVAWAF
jgi:hypothetical protein